MGKHRAKHHEADVERDVLAEAEQHVTARTPARIVPFLITSAIVAVAALLGWAMWVRYFGAPWTRDGTVRVYVVTIAPEIAGRVVALPVVDNQLVRRGDPLLEIDPTDYRIAVSLAEAALAQTQIDWQNAEHEARRRRPLAGSAISVEQQQVYDTRAIAAHARYQQSLASLDQARVNLERTRIRSPVNGWVTNLQARLGDYANVGRSVIAVVDSDSFWVDAYFEETKLRGIRKGDRARIKLMGHPDIIQGRVGSLARAINVANAEPNAQGVATVNPIFTWVRLAQRIPVRIEIDEVPPEIVLVAGMTATVEIDPGPRAPSAAVGAGKP